jgi:sialidase-1
MLSPDQPANATGGKALGSGIALTRGAHAGRLMVALRHDCGCGDLSASLVVYSDDHGLSWRGGAQMMLLPQFGGGWTECEVAELRNGSVLLTSRNSFSRTSGQGPRLFARSDNGGENSPVRDLSTARKKLSCTHEFPIQNTSLYTVPTSPPSFDIYLFADPGESWAANWSAGADLPDPYCEASLLARGGNSSALYFANPSNARSRGNFSVHVSVNGGATWPVSRILYPGPAAYSDLSLTRGGTALGFIFERDNYRYISFGTTPLNFSGASI